jgi:hypothetical protein
MSPASHFSEETQAPYARQDLARPGRTGSNSGVAFEPCRGETFLRGVGITSAMTIDFPEANQAFESGIHSLQLFLQRG